MQKSISEQVFASVIQKGLKQYFQPIVSMKKQRMIGAETLARGFYNEKQVDTGALFEYARVHGEAESISQRCLLTSIDNYKKKPRDYLLFCNIEASQLEYYIDNAENILKMLDECEVEKEKIVLEINEKRVISDAVLSKFVNYYREKGFLIALDDIGEEESNYNRIALVRPDVIKIDHNMTAGIESDYYKKSIAESIAFLAERIGAVVVAEGVENEKQIYMYLDMGIDLFQGFFFSQALPIQQLSPNMFHEKYSLISDGYKKEKLHILKNKEQTLRAKKKGMRELAKKISISKEDEFEQIIYDFLRERPEIECIYILNNQGVQITRTIFNLNANLANVYLFSPFRKNDSHIMCAYFYIPIKDKKSYISEKYRSIATGNFCVTYAAYVKHEEEKEYVVCIDYVS